ncbi:hypothetical protein AGR56_00735 [Clostridium sp. DMHC 10]|nr:hypothetical protein AGR56_00735 [Clostridium sp. DMHC 10]
MNILKNSSYSIRYVATIFLHFFYKNFMEVNFIEGIIMSFSDGSEVNINAMSLFDDVIHSLGF